MSSSAKWYDFLIEGNPPKTGEYLVTDGNMRSVMDWDAERGGFVMMDRVFLVGTHLRLTHWAELPDFPEKISTEPNELDSKIG